jgi:NitT/TauT family transport system substrate-binding protein
MNLHIHAPQSKHHFPIRTAIAAAAMAIVVCICACTRTDQQPASPPEKVAIAFTTTTDGVLADVAQAKGFFRQEGLEIAPHLHLYGKLALDDLLAGKADFATVAETPVMLAVMKGEKISIIATIQTSNTAVYVLARKDRGILTVRDLKGKRIATTLGTSSDFALDVLLGVNGISRRDIQVVDLKAEQMADALAHGDIDAISTFTTYVKLAQKRLDDRVITFQDKDIYRLTFNIVATQEFIRNNPEKVRKVLRALDRAEDFVKKYPVEAQKNVSGFTGVDMGTVRELWSDASYSVALDQALILALEDESRWALSSGLAIAGKIPNYLDFIYLDGLRSVKPGAVRILR